MVMVGQFDFDDHSGRRALGSERHFTREIEDQILEEEKIVVLDIF